MFSRIYLTRQHTKANPELLQKQVDDPEKLLTTKGAVKNQQSSNAAGLLPKGGGTNKLASGGANSTKAKVVPSQEMIVQAPEAERRNSE